MQTKVNHPYGPEIGDALTNRLRQSAREALRKDFREFMDVALPFRLATYGCFLIITISFIAAFIGLDASSLWVDELFTAYFTDPQIAGVGDFLTRAAEDVHPPLYYMLVWAVRQLVEADTVIIMRSVSAVLGVISVFFLYFSLPQSVSTFGRVFACAFAASSYGWYHYTQDARSYTLCFVLGALLLWLAFRLRAAFAEDRTESGLLVAFALVGAISGLSHYYMIPLTGGMLGALFLTTGQWNQRFGLFLVGLFVLAVNFAFINWHADRMVVDPEQVWFQTSPQFLVKQTIAGTFRLFGAGSGVLVSAAVFALSLVTLRADGKTSPDVNRMRDCFFLIGIGALTVLMAIVVTVAYKPSYSFRLFLVLLPVFWALIGLLADAIVGSPSRRAWISAGIVMALLLFQSVKVVWREVPTKGAWRASAQAINGYTECRDADLLIHWFNQRYIGGDAGDIFYGFYLDPSFDNTWQTISRDASAEAVIADPRSNVLQARLDGRDPCPVLFWSVGGRSYEREVAELQAAIETIGMQEDARIQTLRFAPPRSSFLATFLGIWAYGSGRILIVNRSAPTQRTPTSSG